MKRCVRCAALFSREEWRCPSCGYAPEVIRGFPAFAPELARGGGGFDPALFAELARLEVKNFWFRARNRLIVWALQRFFSGAESLLEVGCGTGFVLSGIAAAFPRLRLAGSEADAEGLAFAASRVPGAVLMQMDAGHLPFEEEFDVVAAFDVIEHIDDDRAVLREMHRAAKAGGGIVVTVPQHRFLWSEYDVRARHVRRYTARELREKALGAGFQVIRMTSFVALLLPVMLMSRHAQRARRRDYDPLAELRLAGWLNALLEAVLGCERALIRAGVNFPAGGSLLLIAKKK